MFLFFKIIFNYLHSCGCVQQTFGVFCVFYIIFNYICCILVHRRVPATLNHFEINAGKGSQLSPKHLLPPENLLSKQSLSNPRPAFSCDEWKRHECTAGQDATTHSASSSIPLFFLAPSTCERALTRLWPAGCQACIQSQSPWRRDTQVH